MIIGGREIGLGIYVRYCRSSKGDILKQRCREDYIATKFKYTDRNNKEIDIETQYNDVYVSNNRKYAFPNVLYAKVLKQASGKRRPSNIPEYVPFQLGNLRRDISDLSRKRRCKLFFRNETQENAKETPEFKSKSTWNQPKGALTLKMYLSQTEKDNFSILRGKATKYNLCMEEYLTMRSLQNDRSVAINPEDKDSGMVVWDRTDYLKATE